MEKSNVRANYLLWWMKNDCDYQFTKRVTWFFFPSRPPFVFSIESFVFVLLCLCSFRFVFVFDFFFSLISRNPIFFLKLVNKLTTHDEQKKNSSEKHENTTIAFKIMNCLTQTNIVFFMWMNWLSDTKKILIENAKKKLIYTFNITTRK